MAITLAALPPMAKISMIGIWVETVLYGVNCVMYGLCMFVLLRGGKTTSLRWVLIVISMILFLLATAHVGTSLRQLLEAFVYAPADVPEYPLLYWLSFTSTPRKIKNNLYGALVLVQHFIMIWRLYVVYMYDWRVVILPSVLTAGCVGCAYAASAMSTLPNNGLRVASSLLLPAWVFGFTLNASVTAGIVGRLWWISHKTASLSAASTNRFATSIYVIVESGAISMLASTVVLALYASPTGLIGFDVAFQPVALTPLLVVVQVAMSGRHPTPDTNSPIAPEKIAFRVRIPREDDFWEDESRHNTRLSSSTSFVHDVHV